MFSKAFRDKFVKRGNGFSSKRYVMLVGLRSIVVMLASQVILFGYLVFSLNKVQDALGALAETSSIFPAEAWYGIIAMIIGTEAANAYQANGHAKLVEKEPKEEKKEDYKPIV
jgi:hypothetical protein